MSAWIQISLSFVAGTVFGVLISELTKDIYNWVKGLIFPATEQCPPDPEPVLVDRHYLDEILRPGETEKIRPAWVPEDKVQSKIRSGFKYYQDSLGRKYFQKATGGAIFWLMIGNPGGFSKEEWQEFINRS